MIALPGPHSDELRGHRHHAVEDWDGEVYMARQHTGQIGYMGVTHQWRYPVVDRREPMGVRTVKGYVYVLRRETGGAPQHSVSLTDVNDVPLHTLTFEEFWVFIGAVRETMKEIGLGDYDTEAEELLARGGISRPLKALDAPEPDA